jgi:predicted ATPase/DNA-binding SARP family transcriptional activator
MLDMAASERNPDETVRDPAVAGSPPDHGVVVITLGRFEVRLGDERRTEEDWPRRKVLRLFKCLITQHDRRLSREQAMALFWPDAGPDAASDSLRSSLTILRQTLRPAADLIGADRYHIWINPASDYWCDADEFERLARRALAGSDPVPYQEALALYQGDYLPGDLYDDWATARRDNLRELWFQLAGGLAALYEQAGQLDAAVALLKQVGAQDLCREDLQARLMRLLAQQGRRVEALRHFQQVREALQRELEVDPAPDTVELYEQILRGEIGAGGLTASPASLVARPPLAGSRRELPPPRLALPLRRRGALVGREAEVTRLLGVLDASRDGQLQFALIDGPAGAGKTRLGQHLMENAQARDMLTLTGVAYEQEASLAYGILYDALLPYIQAAPEAALRRQVGAGSEVPAPRAGVLVGVLPALRERLPDLTPPPADSDRLQLFAAFTDFFGALCSDWPVVLFLDDLQWADTASLELLHHLGRHLANSRLLILATRREGEEGAVAATARLGEGLERAGVPVTIITLGGLTREQMRPLISNLLGTPPPAIPDALITQLYDQTEGNPFFVSELVRYFRDIGRLRQAPAGAGGADPPWELVAPAEDAASEAIPLPSRVQEVLNRRIGRLSALARTVLQVGAVLGRSFHYDELQATADLPTDDVINALEEVLAARLLIEQGVRYLFAHPLVRDVIYTGLSGSRRAALHARAGAAIERLAGPAARDERAAELAFHYTHTASTSPEKGLEYSLAAADYARTHYANAEAAALYAQAATLARRVGTLDTRKQLAEGWGNLYLQTGQLAGAVEQFTNLIQLAEEDADTDCACLVTGLARRGEAYRRQNQFDSAVFDFERGLKLAREMDDLAGEVAHLHGLVLVYGPTGQREALNEVSQALLAACERLADRPGGHRALAEALYAVGTYSKMVSGPVREAIDYFRRAIDLAQGIADKDLEARTWMVLCGAQAFAGEWTDSEEAGRRALELYDEIGEQTCRGEVLAVLGEALRGAGRYREALAALQEAQNSPFFGGQQNAYMLLGRLYRDLQQDERFVAHAAEAVEVCRGTIWEVGALNWAAVAEGLTGSRSAALAELESNLARARGVPIRFIEVDTLRELAEGYLERGDLERARRYAVELREVAANEPYSEYLAHAWRLLAACGLATGGEFALEEAAAYLQQAADEAERLGNPPLRWQVAALQAELAGRRGDGPGVRHYYAVARAATQAVANDLDAPERDVFLAAPAIRAIEAGVAYLPAAPAAPTRPASRMAARLEGARRRLFVGRHTELDLFQEALTAPDMPFCVFHVYGMGGIGKTTLLGEFARRAGELGIPVIQLDGRNMDPSPEGVMNALRRALNVENPLQAMAARHGRSVLLIDTYENLAGLDDWIRDVFLPQLPDDTLVVLAGRNPPAAAWLSDPGWQELTRAVELANLTEEEALDYLARRNVPETRRQAAQRFTRGYPLGLSLAVEVLLQQPDASLAGNAPHNVVSALLDRFITDLPTSTARAALEACALVRVTTEPVLTALLGVPNAHAEFEWLRSLSFIYSGPRGLYPHDLAREALEADLKWRDPDSFREMHRRAHQHYVTRMRMSGDDENYHDFVYLHKNPQVRAIFVWDQMNGLHTGPVRPGEWPALRAMVARHEGLEAVRLADGWFARQPEGVTVIRNSTDYPVGFIFHLRLLAADAEQYAADPATAAAWEYLQTESPLGEGEVATMVRWWLAADTYQAISPAQGVAFVIAARVVITTANLARSFHVFADGPAWEAILAHFDLHRLPAADFTVGEHRYGGFTHDWRTTPADAWLAMMAERETSEELAPASPEAPPRPAPTRPPAPATPVAVAPAAPPAGTTLDEAAFAAAVRATLHNLTSPAALATSPLTRTGLVSSRVPAAASAADRGAALRALLVETIAPLQANARDARLYQALFHTYIVPAGSQEQAAERADVPFSTFRRHLKEGIERVTAELWAAYHAGH